MAATKLLINNGCHRRQDALICRCLRFNSKFILNNNRIWEGNVATVLYSRKTIDIDDQIDLDFARFLNTRKIVSTIQITNNIFF